MTKFWALLLALFSQPFVFGADAPDPKLKAILSAYDKREEAADNFEAHRKWITSPVGREESAYLAEHYDSLHDTRKYEVPTELARTGELEAVPLIQKSLADAQNGSHVLSGIFFACHMAGAGEEFRREIAPAVAKWIGKGSTTRDDPALGLLPHLDRDLASKILFNDDFLSPEAPAVDVTLASCNKAGLDIPLPRIQRLLEAWKNSGIDASSDYRILRGYREALRPLPFTSLKKRWK
jgi:hypothetical protein